MKNKTICIIGIILLLTLAAAGCANQPPGENAGGDTVLEDVQEDVQEDTTQLPTAQETDTPQDEIVSSNVSGVTQEDLDNLMASIEGLETEDLGGLSSD